MERIKKIGPWVAIAVVCVMMLSFFAGQSETRGVLATLQKSAAGMSDGLTALKNTVMGVQTRVEGVKTDLGTTKAALDAGLQKNTDAVGATNNTVKQVAEFVAELRRDLPAIAARAATTALAQDKCGVKVDGMSGRCTKACLAYLAGESVAIPPDCFPASSAEAALPAMVAPKKEPPKVVPAEPAVVQPPPAAAGPGANLLRPSAPVEASTPPADPLAGLKGAVGDATSAAARAEKAVGEVGARLNAAEAPAPVVAPAAGTP